MKKGIKISALGIIGLGIIMTSYYFLLIKPKKGKKVGNGEEPTTKQPTIKPKPSHKPTKKEIPFIGVVTANVLNVRTGASLFDSIVTKLNRGRTVNVVGETGNWYEIQLPPLTGNVYVHKAYIK